MRQSDPKWAESTANNGIFNVSVHFENLRIKELIRSKQIKQERMNVVTPFCKYGNLSSDATDPDRKIVHYFFVYQIAIIFNSSMNEGKIRDSELQKLH